MNDKVKIILNKIYSVVIVFFKIIITIILTYFIMILPITAIIQGKMNGQIFLIIVLFTLLAIFTNWAIWKKGCFSKILMAIILLIISSILLIRMMDYLGIKSDYCIEDGDCKEGRIIYVKEKEILINKDSCLKNNWEWWEKSKTCKITKTSFRVKEVIYD